MLRRIGEELVERLAAVPNVSRVQIVGASRAESSKSDSIDKNSKPIRSISYDCSSHGRFEKTYTAAI